MREILLPYKVDHGDQELTASNGIDISRVEKLLTWYMNRLRSMSAGEVVWRLSQKLQVGSDYLRMMLSRFQPHRRPLAKTWTQRERLYHQATGKTPLHIRLFDLTFPLEKKFDWHHDYYTSHTVATIFAPRINTRDLDVVGDIKYIWELNRHQYLSMLAYTRWGQKHGDLILTTLAGWVRENPYLWGVNWTSNLELALRVISWTLILDSPPAGDTISDEALTEIYRSVEQQLGHISRHLSCYSSANNHLIGEAAGLYVGSLAFPGMPRAHRWQRWAKAILEREIGKQVTADGVNREQSMAYHLFTAEFFLLAAILGASRNDPFTTAFLTRLKDMLIYLSHIMTATGDLPNFGDSDDGRAFLVSAEESHLRVVMELGGVLFEAPEFLRLSNQPSTAVQVLFGPAGVQRFNELKQDLFAEPPLPALFREGGKAILGSRSKARWAVVDVGNHGYPSLAAHAHADALSVQLAIDGTYVLVDPGTYAYYSHRDRRDYFRGTAAHNTVRVDGENQSVIRGRFLWSHQACTRLLTWEPKDACGCVEAEHDGYRRLPDPVVHRRQVRFEGAADKLVIIDQLHCQRQHEIEIFFHLHQEFRIEGQDGDRVTVGDGHRRLTFSTSLSSEALRVYQGNENPIAGWQSTAFHHKFPIITLCYNTQLQGITEITTTITIS